MKQKLQQDNFKVKSKIIDSNKATAAGAGTANYRE